MGKSPARWIKNVLLGKKTAKSSVSKGKKRFLNEKDVLVTAKVEETAPEMNPSMVVNPISDHSAVCNNVQEMEKLEAATVLDDEIRATGDHQSTEFQETALSDELSEADKIQQDKAAIALQAVFRGYLARGAFWALKGIIRLQALTRGHLVRRQAVATLSCVMGVVRLQATVRGRHVRQSEIGVKVYEKCRHQLSLKETIATSVDKNAYLGIKKLSANAFIQKLLAPLPRAMPLRLQYDSSDSNSVQSWLENWSASQFWDPVPQSNIPSGKRLQKKNSDNHMACTEATRPKKSVRKVPAANLDTRMEFEKPKRNIRKVPSQAVEPPTQENPQIELEKIKRNLRKVHNPVVDNSILQSQPHPEFEAEKPKLGEMSSQSQPSNSVHDIVEQPIIVSDETMKNKIQETETVIVLPDPETPEPVKETESANQSDHANFEPNPLTETESKDKNSSGRDTKGNQKTGKKSHVPSYMQATQSAKAKLRLQGSPMLIGQDGAEKNGSSRRHSLPSSNNGRVTLDSSRTQRAVNSGGKSGSRKETTTLSSRVGNGKNKKVTSFHSPLHSTD